ncbi:MAG TPA: hypothetical protein PKK00_07490 [Bacteroidales bacterium]|nr:hypothetical protein [Bacteroidales bacterium]HPS17262.1 hypothetical protein [Bacteroidales bacterium]
MVAQKKYLSRYIKLYLVLALLILFIYSCDCIQHVQGVIIDSSTKVPVDSSSITRYYKGDTVNIHNGCLYTDINGRFEFTTMAGGLFGCPRIRLLIKKEGYEALIKEYRSCCTDNDTILLKRTIKK